VLRPEDTTNKLPNFKPLRSWPVQSNIDKQFAKLKEVRICVKTVCTEQEKLVDCAQQT